jgi:SpoVK/Ycf46/Vps4 family AAA+-type ATPase
MAFNAATEDNTALQQLGQKLGLSETDIDIIRFRLATERYRELRPLLIMAGRETSQTVIDILTVCLNRPEADIAAALAFDGSLLSTGIVELQPAQFWFNESVNLLECLIEELHCKRDDPIAYFRSRIVKSSAPRLTAGHFPHVARDHDILRQYLVASQGERRRGVNILIHGEPGTGKTEFVRMLASELGDELYEVAAARRNGSVLDSSERFRAYRLSQALFERSSGRLILFDEIEDVFRESDMGDRTRANKSSRKAWVNKMLESNPVPAFWISNNIRVIDRSYLRRFDYILEMKVPPRSVRSRILDEYLRNLPVSESWKQRMAEHEELVPAVVERAAKVVRSVKTQAREETERSLTTVMGNTLEVMGIFREPRRPPLVAGYRLDVLNADCDIAEVQTNLMTQRQGRICLYGPPGTGKTAYGQHVATQLDRPLLLRRASDIISPWVGMTEKNLARMFRQAQEDEAVLLLDEADSFLQDRQGAQRSWEVTEVNEMLTQMETFEGIFIASTNLMTSLDSAALRRFDLKIRFDYLKPEQAWALFVDTRTQLGIEDEQSLQSSVACLALLTPGDFANVVRQARLRPVRSSIALLQRLRAECQMKPEGRRLGIGFCAA